MITMFLHKIYGFFVLSEKGKRLREKKTQLFTYTYTIIEENFEKVHGQTPPKLQITGAGDRDSFCGVCKVTLSNEYDFNKLMVVGRRTLCFPDVEEV